MRVGAQVCMTVSMCISSWRGKTTNRMTEGKESGGVCKLVFVWPVCALSLQHSCLGGWLYQYHHLRTRVLINRNFSLLVYIRRNLVREYTISLCFNALTRLLRSKFQQQKIEIGIQFSAYKSKHVL